ncbi:MAG: hypothetical protein K0R01_1232 [Mycobacterium sp.]|jgi:hypothetical protein|nr:hypothetical protein [Mycobacterium sp.]
MVGLIVFAVLVLALIALVGLPYPQSWHSRWGSSDR